MFTLAELGGYIDSQDFENLAILMWIFFVAVQMLNY